MIKEKKKKDKQKKICKAIIRSNIRTRGEQCTRNAVLKGYCILHYKIYYMKDNKRTTKK